MYVYILKCNNDKYYVGKTNNLKQRLKDHENGNVYWTKINKFIRLEELIQDADDFDEDKYVKIYMKKYGVENVRGGSYSQCKLPKNKLDILKVELYSSDNRCYRCGELGHYINQCTIKTKKCSICRKEGHNSRRCTNKYYATSTIILNYNF